MERACISHSLSVLAVPEGNPFPARSFLPFCLLHEYFVREQPRGPLSRFPHDSSPLSAGYFSLLQSGLRILATCHCPRNDYAVSDSPPWDNISLGHPIIVGMRLTLRHYFYDLSIYLFSSSMTRAYIMILNLVALLSFSLSFIILSFSSSISVHI